ncbi:hypothetical protein FKM82_014048 [Ascaphus truei]
MGNMKILLGVVFLALCFNECLSQAPPTEAPVTEAKLKISVFSDSELTNLLYSSQRISPGAPLYVVVEAQNTGGKQHVLLVNSFFASNSQNSANTDFINHFIKDGCLANDTVTALPISDNEQLKKTFLVKAFKVSGSDQFFLHTNVSLCDMTTSSCAHDYHTSGRKRREAPDVVTAELQYLVKFKDDQQEANSSPVTASSTPWLFFSLLGYIVTKIM